MATATTAIPTVTRYDPADDGRSLTLDQYLGADFEEGYRYELARGMLEVSNIPAEPHGLIVWWLLRLLGRYCDQNPGMVYRVGGSDGARIVIPGLKSGRHPDVSVLLRGTTADTHGDLQPALAIEVVSPGASARRRDYATKRAEYLAYGLLEYWIVDRFEQKVTVLTRDGDAWSERVFEGDDSATGLVLPGFSARLADLWTEAERAAGVEGSELDEVGPATADED